MIFHFLSSKFVSEDKKTGIWRIFNINTMYILTVSRFFRKSKIQPLGSRQSTGYDIRQQIILFFEKMIHVHVASGSPAGCCYMTQSGTYEHQSTLTIGKSADCFCPAFDLTVETLNGIVGPDPGPVLCGKIHIG